MAVDGNIPLENVLPLVDDVARFQEALGSFFRKSGSSPIPGSPADLELNGFPQPGLVKTAYSQANLLFNSAGDHMDAFTRIAKPPVNPIAAWTIVRGAIEAAAMSAWLYEPDINVTERVKRSYAYRYESIEQERKLLVSIGAADEAKKAVDRLDFLENEASSLGYPRVLNKNRQRMGIGMVMPSNTEVIKQAFGDEVQYRIMSGMAHSLPYATTKLAHKIASPEVQGTVNKTKFYDNLVILEQGMSGGSLGVLCVWIIQAMTKPVWFYCKLFGFDETELTGILDRTTDRLMRPELRIWRPKS
jgi:hypothetical protein